jgi:predicted Zn-dependent protease
VICGFLLLFVTAAAQSAAVNELREAAERAPSQPRGWYALGQAYNTIKQEAIASLGTREDFAWQQLLAADALMGAGRLTDAFTLYRESLARLPSMVTIHDSVARIYEQTGHADWAARERTSGALSADECVRRKPLCEFRSSRYLSSLDSAMRQSDAESRYWRARAANELALAAFTRLDGLADSLERRAVRATLARAEDRTADAIAELGAALKFSPGHPALLYELASTHYAARDYEQAIATLSPLLERHPDDPRYLKLSGYALIRLRRVDEALPVLQRAADRDPGDPGPRLALGQAYLLNGDFAAAVPLIEAQLEDDQDGSVHVQLARAYIGLGQRDKAAPLLARAEEIQRTADERSATVGRRTITPPK